MPTISSCAPGRRPGRGARRRAALRRRNCSPASSVWGALITAADEPRTWGLMFLYFVSFGGFLALTAWFPTYWVNLHHVSLRTAGILGGAGFSLLAARDARVGRLAVGTVRRRAAGAVAFAIVLVGAGLLTVGDGLPAQPGGRAADRARHGPRPTPRCSRWCRNMCRTRSAAPPAWSAGSARWAAS